MTSLAHLWPSVLEASGQTQLLQGTEAVNLSLH